MNNVAIIAYDISDDKIRTRFSKFLSKYGTRIQFSVYEVRNSNRIIDLVKNAIESKFGKAFAPGDSVYIFTANQDNTWRYGSASLLDNDLIML